MWKIILLIGLLLLINACTENGEETVFNEDNRGANVYTIDKSIVINDDGINLNFRFETEDNPYTIKMGISSDSLQTIEFMADKIVFTDGKINLTFSKDFFWSFKDYDKMIWNINNKTYVYILDKGLEYDGVYYIYSDE